MIPIIKRRRILVVIAAMIVSTTLLVSSERLDTATFVKKPCDDRKKRPQHLKTNCEGMGCAGKIKIATTKSTKGKQPWTLTRISSRRKPCKSGRTTKTTSTKGKVPSPQASVPNDPNCTGKSCPTPNKKTISTTLKIPKKPCKTDKTTKTTSTSGKVPPPKPSLPKEPSCNGKSCSKPTPESSIPKNVPTPASSVSKEQSKDSSKTKDGEAYKVTTKTSCSSISSIVWSVQLSAFVSLLSYIA